MKKFWKVIALVLVVLVSATLPMACSSGSSQPTPVDKTYTVTFDSCGGEYVEPVTTSNGHI